jgi:hypothetical protein
VGTASGLVYLNLVSGCTATQSGSTFNITCTGGSGSSVTVNGGSSLSTANFNATTPAAAAGFTNCTPQTSTTNVSVECPVALMHYAPIPSSDTITQAACASPPCTFATTQSISGTGLKAGSLIVVNAMGLYTTTTTASPLMQWAISLGGTTNLCSQAVSNTLTTSLTAAFWSIQCYVQIQTTGAPGTATNWGTVWKSSQSGTGGTFGNTAAFGATAPQSFTTTSAQTLSISETATMVSGQTFTLQSLDIQVVY